MSHNGHAYRADSYRCHDFKAETPQTTITAGASLGLAWTLDVLDVTCVSCRGVPPCAGAARDILYIIVVQYGNSKAVTGNRAATCK